MRCWNRPFLQPAWLLPFPFSWEAHGRAGKVHICTPVKATFVPTAINDKSFQHAAWLCFHSFLRNWGTFPSNSLWQPKWRGATKPHRDPAAQVLTSDAKLYSCPVIEGSGVCLEVCGSRHCLLLQSQSILSSTMRACSLALVQWRSAQENLAQVCLGWCFPPPGSTGSAGSSCSALQTSACTSSPRKGFWDNTSAPFSRASQSLEMAHVSPGPSEAPASPHI